ncbi:MIR motif-containing protein [Halteromyces radiatus]|uniref:MIR motif-containing protein n=1 Tax=Halteromyces radiatus TaxID=101107 RepID=UPI00221F853E|nr:MIR motif-containing protein [Halteromyces radiatus]KAI8093535.1 MIR motif-containing protein [Halteromyces radiatus]
MKLSLLLLGLFPFVLATKNIPEIEEGYEKVTCGSTIKIANKATQYRLHSHGVSYGSGSGQQSVTGFVERDDPNSFWLVRAAHNRQCIRGQAVPCGAIIRLRHTNTKGYLHSHLHSSPLSGQQEVSCFDGNDGGDDWQVQCVDSTQEFWLREQPIHLIHVDSNTYLTSSPQYQYGQPIPGQLEVATAKSSSKNTQWIAQEGIYFASTS